MSIDKPTLLPLDISYNAQKLTPEDILPLLLTKYPIIISPNAESPYGLHDETGRPTKIDVTATSPMPWKEDYPFDFDSNPLSHPEVARLFAQKIGWFLFDEPPISRYFHNEGDPSVRTFPFANLCTVLNAAFANYHPDQNEVYKEAVKGRLAAWEAERAHVRNINMSWTVKSFNRKENLLFYGELDLGAAQTPRLPALAKQKWNLEFKLGYRNPEIDEWSRRVVGAVEPSAIVQGLESEFEENENKSVKAALKTVDAYLKSVGNHSTVSYSEKVQSKVRGDERKTIRIERGSRRYLPKDRSDSTFTTPEMYAEAALALEATYFALRQVVGLEAEKSSRSRDLGLAKLSTEMNAIGTLPLISV